MTERLNYTDATIWDSLSIVILGGDDGLRLLTSLQLLM